MGFNYTFIEDPLGGSHVTNGFWFKFFNGVYRSEEIRARAILASRTKGQDAESFRILGFLVVVVVTILLVLGAVVWWICKCTIPSVIYIAFITCTPVYYYKVALT